MANEPKNLYQLEDFFRLFVMGVYYYIDEPVNWDKISIKGERDKDYFGLNYEFIDDKVTLTFPQGEGMEIIRGVYGLQGGDGKIVFEYGYIQEGIKKVQFIGNLNLNTYHITDEGVECSVEKTAFEGLLRTRYETKIALNATEDLDGNGVTPPAPIYVKLHSKQIKKYGKAQQVEEFEPTGSNVSGNFSSFYIQPDTSNIVKQEVEEMQAMPLGASNVAPQTEKRFQFIAKEAGKGTVTFSVKATIRIQNLFNSVGAWNLTGQIALVRNNSEISFTAPMNARLSGSTASKTVITPMEFTISLQANWQIGDEVYCYISGTKNNDGGYVALTAWEGYVEIMQETKAPASVCLGYKLFDAFNHVVRCITGKENAVQSGFFGPDGCASKFMITNGYQIRNFEVSQRPVQISLQELMEGVHPIWFVGLQYSQDETGDDVVLLEKAPSFFGSKRIYHCARVWDYEEQHIKELTFNEAEIGYQKFAEEDINTLDEFNTYQQYLLPITTYKAKYSKKSRFIASGYSIEIARREQFKESPSTSLSTDDDIFIVSYLTERKYKNVTFNLSGVFMELNRPVDLQVGETFKIARTGGSNNNTTFTIVAKDDSGVEKYRVSPAPTTDSGVGDLEILISGPVAERNEAFDVVQGVISPESAYNLRISPKRMLWNHAPLLNCGIIQKPVESVIKNTFTKNNGDLITKFAEGENCKGMEANLQLREKEGIVLKGFNGGKWMFLPTLATFKTKIYYDDLVYLKERLTGQTKTDEDFGMISFPDLEGGIWMGHVWDFEYTPQDETCSFSVRKVQKI